MGRVSNIIEEKIIESRNLIQTVRKLWQVFFFLFILGIGFWLFRSLFITGNFLKYLDFSFSCVLFLFLFGVVSYLFAFRLKNEDLLINLSLSLGVLILLILISEAGIRIWNHYDPIFRPAYLEDVFSIVTVEKGKEKSFGCYSYRSNFTNCFKPNSAGMTHGHTVRINNLGFRGPDYPTNKPPNGFRILVLGDSFTFGQGIGDSEVYPALLEKDLGLKYPRKTIEVINLGIPGYSTVDEMNLLYKVGPLLNPDLILIGFTGNDVREGPQVTDEEKSRWEIPIPRGIKGFMQSHLKLFAWLAIKYNKLLTNIGARPSYETSIGFAYNTGSEEWKRFVTAYKKILEWTQTRGLPPPVVGLFLMIHNPNQDDFINMTRSARMQMRYTEQVRLTLNSMGIHTVDYLPLFQQFQHHNKQTMMVSKWEGHPSAAADQLYAEGFLDAILALNLIH